jgi:predicted metal-dependent peptidase
MKKELLYHCLEAEEARLYDFVSACNVIETDRIPTACINNKGQLFINRMFYEDVKDHIIGLILHESLHVYFDHVNRKYENPRVANVAHDIVINNLILNIGYSLPSQPCTYESCDVPTSLKTSDEIYEYLMENMPDEDLMDMLEEAHSMPDDDNYEEGDVETINAIASSMMSDIEYRIEQNKRQQYNVKEKSNIVKSIDRVLGRFLKPDFKRTYTRPSRHQSQDVLLPSSRAIVHKPTLSIYLDVSSSMDGNNIDKAFGVLNDLQTTLAAYKQQKFIFNTHTKEVDGYDVAQIGGGTCFERFHDNDHSDVVLIITDCEFSFNFLEGHNRKSVIVLALTHVEPIKNCEVFSA